MRDDFVNIEYAIFKCKLTIKYTSGSEIIL